MLKTVRKFVDPEYGDKQCNKRTRSSPSYPSANLCDT